MPNASLWVLTTYFNPMRYGRRLRNYHAFREELRAPLVTVEVGYHDGYDLKPSDADRLLQLRGKDVLWQKERLLNVALSCVPEDVPYVAWLDCDVILDRADWTRAVAGALEAKPIVQPFSAVYDLARDVAPTDIDTARVPPSSTSMGYKLSTNTWTETDFRPATQLQRSGIGFGWAARKELLDRHGFYDAMVLGSGDRMMIYAACGRFSDAIELTRLNSAQTAHYLAWARPFASDVRGQLGYVQGNLFHLWHGELKDRRYRERLEGLAPFDFDPSSDIAIDAQGCWTWASPKPLLATYVAEYFASRNEDGVDDETDVLATVLTRRRPEGGSRKP